MINQQLLDYIKQQTQQGVSPDAIKNALRSNGWVEADIAQAFSNNVAPQNSTFPSEAVQPFNPQGSDTSHNKLPVMAIVIVVLLLLAGLAYAAISLTAPISSPAVTTTNNSALSSLPVASSTPDNLVASTTSSTTNSAAPKLPAVVPPKAVAPKTTIVPPVKPAQVSTPNTTNSTLPNFDLTGYTKVDASNVSFSPPTNSTLTIGVPIQIVATSPTKKITQILLMQTVKDYTDSAMMYATQAPFSIPFKPTRLGTADFVAFANFSDKTYAVMALSYTLEPSGKPTSLTITNYDHGVLSLRVGQTNTFEIIAEFPNGPVDVSAVSTYGIREGQGTVFQFANDKSSGSGEGGPGTIKAVGKGTDWFDVTYMGLTTAVQITVY